jgi:hypothetical protein
MRDLEAEAQNEVQGIKHLLRRYRVREAIDRLMDFSQSFFKQGSREHSSFRDYATSLSDRYSWIVDPTNISGQETKDGEEDHLIRELSRLANDMGDAIAAKSGAECGQFVGVG